MEALNFLSVSLCLSCLVCSLNAEVVPFEACSSNSGQCQINEVRFDSCPETLEHKPCVVKRQTATMVSFDFTPGWTADTIDDHWFLVTDDGVEWRLSALNIDGCPYASDTCPIQASTKHSFQYTLIFAKKFRTGTYTMKWIIANNAKSANITDRCCFTTKVKIIR